MTTRSMTRFAAAVFVACGTALVAWQDAAVVPFGGAASIDCPVYRGDAKGNQRIRPIAKTN